MSLLPSIHDIRKILIPACVFAARSAAAQGAAPPMPEAEASPPVPSIHDTARATALACSIIQGLRPVHDRHGCRLERFVHDARGYSIRLVEVAPPGKRSGGDRSEVAFPEGTDTVIVTRITQP
jgi:hypothetical protein